MNYDQLKNNLGGRQGSVGTPKASSSRYPKIIDYKALEADSGIQRLKFVADEEYNLDILPFPVESDNHPDYKSLRKQYGDEAMDFQIALYLHAVQVGNSKSKFICPSKTYGKPCPFCEEKNRLFKLEGGYEAHKEEIKALNDSRRDYMFVHNRKDGKVYLMEYSNYYLWEHVEKKLARTNKGDSQVILAYPGKNGHSLKFFVDPSNIKGSKGETLPGQISDIEFIPRPEALPADIVETLPPLDKYIVQYPYDDLVSFLDGTYFATSGDDDEQEDIGTPYKTAEEKKQESESKAPPKKEEPAIDPREARRQARLNREAPKEDTPKCPAGGVFGKDNCTFDECDTCPLYEACEKEYLKLTPTF